MEILLTNENEKPAGFMIPIPQYPFYTATIAEFNAKQVATISYRYFINIKL